MSDDEAFIKAVKRAVGYPFDRTGNHRLTVALSLAETSGRDCPPLLKMLSEGRGGFSQADIAIRKDGIDYRIQADWVDDLIVYAVRLKHAMLDPAGFLAEEDRRLAEIRALNAGLSGEGRASAESARPVLP